MSNFIQSGKLFCISIIHSKNILLVSLIFGMILFSGLSLASDRLLLPGQFEQSVKENANTVYQMYDQSIDIKSEKSAILNMTEVITVLNKNGVMNSYFKVFVNAMRSLRSFRGVVLDANGKVLKTLGMTDIIDRSFIDNSSIYTDNRIKFADPGCETYPFTVQYDYSIEYNQTFFLPSWTIYNQNTSYIEAKCEVTVPADYKFRFKEYNLPVKSSVEEKAKKMVYKWQLHNIFAKSGEEFSDYTKPQFPSVEFVSENFKIKDTTGSLKTWTDFGVWCSGLIDGKDVLPEATKTKIKQMTDTCTSDFSKVKILYEYMQQKSRYVSIQIGIGGFVPFDATTVDNTSYGDCKALSNYMKSLLAAVGIKAKYCLINAGSDADLIDEEFPSSQFNHAIVCVPQKNDTIWLECTSQHLPCGYTGDFTDNRKTLIVDGDSSKLVNTIRYSSEKNSVDRFYSVHLQDIESGSAELNTTYAGLSYENILPVYYALNDDRKFKMVEQSISLPSFNLIDFNYIENKGVVPDFIEKIHLSFRNYINKLSGDVFLLPLNFMNNTVQVPERSRNRISDVYVRRPYKESTQVEFALPPDYKVNELPEPVKIDAKFGRYSNEVLLIDGKVIFKRKYELYNGVYPASEYNDFRNFALEIVSADKVTVQITK